MPSSRLVALLVATLAVLGLGGASAASAATVTKTVPAVFVFEHGQNPTDPGNCSAVSFAQWTAVLGTISATAKYTSLLNAAWGERSESRRAPFDDTYTWVKTYAAPPGTNRIQLGKGWRDGPGVDDCSDMNARAPSGYRGVPTVELTIEEPAACAAARKRLAKAEKQIATLRKRLKAAPVRRRAGIKLQIRRASKEKRAATRLVSRRCE